MGQMAIQSAWMFGAGRVIGIDKVPEHLRLAESKGSAETIDFSKTNLYDALMDMTSGRGPDRCIDAVGGEAEAGSVFGYVKEWAKQAAHLAVDRPHVLREAVICCRKGGTISVPGVYLDGVDVPYGAAMNKAITIKTGQTHVQKYLEPLLPANRKRLDRPLIHHNAQSQDRRSF